MEGKLHIMEKGEWKESGEKGNGKVSSIFF